MKNNHEHYKSINSFEFDISYIDITASSQLNVHENHIHDAYEIYINLSGDVSFSVENSLYPIMPGNIIVTKPFEYHHCVYHSEEPHKHFWILLQATCNDILPEVFYNREVGKNNLLILDLQKTNEMIEICHNLCSASNNEIEKYYNFFGLMRLLNSADTFNLHSTVENSCITEAIHYINNNLSTKILVKDIAKMCNVSISTLERHFVCAFNLSPYDYIKKRRLANAVRLLSEGHSVTDSAYLSGFSDCSKFIAMFKKIYNQTPLQYKNNRIKKIISKKIRCRTKAFCTVFY